MTPSGSNQQPTVPLHLANRIADLGHGVALTLDWYGFGRIPASLNRKTNPARGGVMAGYQTRSMGTDLPSRKETRAASAIAWARTPSARVAWTGPSPASARAKTSSSAT